MTPFKTKLTISQYENLGYVLKTGDTIYYRYQSDYVEYGKLTKFDEKGNRWFINHGNKTVAVPFSKQGHFIEMMVVPFDQYLKKMKEKGTSIRK